MKYILTIAGSDSSGGAGIQGDIKSISAYGHHALTVVTAITAQNSQEVSDIIPVHNVAAQLKAISDDIEPNAIKIGMLYTKKNVREVIEFLIDYGIPKKIPIVLDPLMIASTGKALVSDDALDMICHQLIPLCQLVTPNQPELSVLKKMCPLNDPLTDLPSEAFLRYYESNFLIKGGHSASTKMSTDTLWTHDSIIAFQEDRLHAYHTHGTGCCLSSAIACELANGHSLVDSIRFAKSFITMAITHGYQVGRGEGPVDPLIHFITNHVSSNDVANCTIASGGRPIMAEATEEMNDIIPQVNGLVINIGTLTSERLHTMSVALNHINPTSQKVLLDPVGCAASHYRLHAARKLLHTGKVAILKANAQEGLALLNEEIHDGCGVDSKEITTYEKEQLAKNLVKKYKHSSLPFIAVITGAIDVVSDGKEIISIEGGSSMQQQITGTGCMLGGIIMTHVSQNDTDKMLKAVISGIQTMNNASAKAAQKVDAKRNRLGYKQHLLEELTPSVKSLYLITDESLDFEGTLLPKTKEALEAGLSHLQYRVKKKGYVDQLEEASTLRQLCHQFGTKFIINDDITLAKHVGADGVHLGQSDCSIILARKTLGSDAIIGVTAKTVEQAITAQKQGADYLGVGALYHSSTKPDAKGITIQTLKNIRQRVHIPIYGIGGIRHYNLTTDIIANVDGVAVVSALYQGDENELEIMRDLLRQ